MSDASNGPNNQGGVFNNRDGEYTGRDRIETYTTDDHSTTNSHNQTHVDARSYADSSKSHSDNRTLISHKSSVVHNSLSTSLIWLVGIVGLLILAAIWLLRRDAPPETPVRIVVETSPPQVATESGSTPSRAAPPVAGATVPAAAIERPVNAAAPSVTLPSKPSSAPSSPPGAALVVSPAPPTQTVLATTSVPVISPQPAATETRVATAASSQAPGLILDTVNGRYRFLQGESIAFKVRASRDCYLVLSSRQADGSTVILFPNLWNFDCGIRANVDYEIPGPNKDGFVIEVTPPFGTEFVTALARTGRSPVHDALQTRARQTTRAQPFVIMPEPEFQEYWRNLTVLPATHGGASVSWVTNNLVIQTVAR